MIGRNDLCPCGSGKKYKKCCLQKNQLIEFTKNRTIYAKGLYRNLENKIIEYANQECFNGEKEACKNIFYISDVNDVKIDRFFKTYFVHDYMTKNKKAIANIFVEENQMNLNKSQKSILIGMFNSYISIFNVEEIGVTNALVRDCITDDKMKIEDVEVFKNLKVGDKIIGRPVNTHGMNMFVDDTIKLSQKNANIIIDNIKQLYKGKEKTLNNLKEFLMYHSEVIYKFTQQILLSDELCMVKPQLLNHDNEKDYKEEKDNQLDIYDILKDNIEEQYLQKGIDLWKEFVKAKKSITGNENGWAAAVEYYIKKDAGETITQAQISQKYEVSPRTLGKRYKELKAS